jgi:hypothetical protein
MTIFYKNRMKDPQLDKNPLYFVNKETLFQNQIRKLNKKFHQKY